MKKRTWKAFLLAVSFGIILHAADTSAEDSKILNGNGVQAQFLETTGEITLYGCQEDGTTFQMSRPSHVSYPVINGTALSDFTDFTCRTEENINGTTGTGNRMTITSRSASTGLTRVCKLESVNDIPGLLYVQTSYTAEKEDQTIENFTDCEFSLYEPEQTVWSYNGGGEGQQSFYDTLQKIDLTDNTAFSRANRQDETSAGIPAADIYSKNGGITVGDASAARRELKTPVEEKNQTVYASIQRPSMTIKAGETVYSGEGFVHVHTGDYYNGLRGYANGMQKIGFKTLSKEEIPESSYDLRWESWGWEFDWTLDLILGKLDELKELGIKQVTLDDGWYINAGEWDLNREKLPNGDADMKRLTDEIHKRGMTALLWWRPCDGGREESSLYKEHPEYFVKNQNGTIGKLAGPGAKDSFNGTTGYALCPASEGAVKTQVDFVKKAISEWGFDGLKSDYVWSIPKCCNPEHNHQRPEESTEQQAVFYREIYRAMTECKKDAFHLLCNCGTPQDYYSLPYVTQVPTADPTSVDQTRRRVKAYKALCGDYFPITTDHNEIWYPSAVGTGAVLIEKRNMTGSEQAEYEKWLKIAQKTELQKGEFIGNLYSYGFDPYETYAVKKDGRMYYAFYRDGKKYSPQGNPKVELKGLNPDRLYRIVDYVNDQVIATNVPGSEAVFDHSFSSYLLLYAEELSRPDSVRQEITAEETEPGLTFEGSWSAEQNSGFSGGSCKYTTEENASVTFTFQGSSIAWYGQKDTNFGTAQVYIDNIPDSEVTCRGTAASGVKLYEKTGLSDSTHTIKIVCRSPVIDVDRFVYTKQSAGSASSTASVSQFTSSYKEDVFAQGTGWEDFTKAKDALDRLIAEGNADADELAQAEDAFFQALFELRKPIQKDLLESPAPVLDDVETDQRDTGILYRTLIYAENLDMSDTIPAVRTLYQEALANAWQVFRNSASDQNEINRAFAELLDKIQYAGYIAGDKSDLRTAFADCQKINLYHCTNPQAFTEALKEAEIILNDENATELEINQILQKLLAAKNNLDMVIAEEFPPMTVKNITAAPGNKTLKITWEQQPDASSYTVYIQKGKTWEAAGTTESSTLTIKKLKAATKYQIKVTASNRIGRSLDSKILYTATKPSKPKVKKVQNYKETGLKITCKKKGETGFEVWVKTRKKTYKKAATGSKTVTLKKGIRTNQKVSVKIRGYVKNKNTKVYGAFRNIKFK